ncbi:class A beta-lactamase [Spirillospora sp. NPDC127200]
MELHTRRRAKFGFAALAAATLLTGTACGTNASPAQTSSVSLVAQTRSAPAATTDLARTLRALEASYQGRIGAAAIDMSTGRTVGYRADERFAFNSTFKAYACAAVLRKARDTDPRLMDRVIRWKAGDVLPGSPETGEYTDTGMTPAQLCRATITTSDNLAGNLLLKQIGGPAGMTRYFRSLGDRTSRLDRYETDLNTWKPGEPRDTTTPKAAAHSLSRITTGNALDRRDRQRLVGWLRATVTGNERIRAGLPKDWTVGDKTGTGGAQNHGTANDIAVAWPPGSSAPIVLTVYTHRNANGVEPDSKVIAETATALAKALGRL